MVDKGIYLDNGAATRMDERVLEAMMPYYFDIYSIATSEFGYSLGIEAREALDAARNRIAESIGAEGRELIFTSGPTEASNLALKGAVRAREQEDTKHIIISSIEDFPVLYSAKELERSGVEISYLPVDEYGFVDPVAVREAIQDSTILVSIQHANQEIGTLQPIGEIGDVCRENGVLFHVDATHSFTRVPIDVREQAVDMLSLSAHTIHGPKGIGALYVRKGTKLHKIQDGGFQEFNLRAGYENIPGAVGFAKAVELVSDEENKRLKEIRDRLIDRIMAEIPDVTLNGHRDKRLPTNANITFHYIEGESITLHLDMYGISVSTGSACFSRSLEASHVISAIGGGHERAHGSIRMTLGRYNNMDEVDVFVDRIKEIVAKLREISPLG